MTRKKPKIKIVATGSAKAELVAKASYQHKKTVTEVIPPDVSRAKAERWLDLISPLTEWAGLRGDQLRGKRELLRLQQEDSLLRVGEQVRERLKKIGVLPRPIPTKALVPLLEKASLESPDSKLIEAWANLIASASVNYDSEVITFSSILSEIGPREGSIIERMFGSRKDLLDLEITRTNSSAGALAIAQRVAIVPLIREGIEHSDLSMFSRLTEFFPYRCCLMTQVARCKVLDGIIIPELIVFDHFHRSNASGFEILVRQGLIKRGEVGILSDHKAEAFQVIWFEFTELGYAFVKRVVSSAFNSQQT
ncbi:MAG: hypothetical protein HYX37_09385 [Rhizobiales bacterium]|nr:hypothetical protein [Hyphomicrobiales bacterium]